MILTAFINLNLPGKLDLIGKQPETLFCFIKTHSNFEIFLILMDSILPFFKPKCIFVKIFLIHKDNSKT